MAGKKGQQRREKVLFRERLIRYMKTKRIDPHYWMVKCLADDSLRTTVTADGATVLTPTVPLGLKFACAKELAAYLEPKRKAVILTGDAANPVTLLHAMPQADLDALITRLLRQTGYASGPAPALDPDPGAPPEAAAP
jgi:hypothetical protein